MSMDINMNIQHLMEIKCLSVYVYALTKLINSINISVAGDELLHHALHCQPSGQDKSCGAVVHPCIQIRRPCPDQNLKRKVEIRCKHCTCQKYESSVNSSKGSSRPLIHAQTLITSLYTHQYYTEGSTWLAFFSTWKTPWASAATAACRGVRPVLSCALASAPASSRRLAASARA